MLDRFIVFEGIDGSGKSTVSELVYHRLALNSGRPVIYTAEPSDGKIGQVIRSYLRADCKTSDPSAVALLFAADRRMHYYDVVEPALKKGYVVICDRFRLSGLAYQPASGVDAEWLYHIDQVPDPGLTFYIDIPVEVSLARIAARKGKNVCELYEKEDKLIEIRNRYCRLIDKEYGNYISDTKFIDGTQPLDDVVRTCTNIVIDALGLPLGKS